MNISPYIQAIHNLKPLEIKTSFKPNHWLNYDFKNPLITASLIYIIDNYSDGISRQDIITYLSSQDRSLLIGFLMTMIWGHGYSEYSRSDNRGPWKVAQMLDNLELAEEILGDANENLKNNNIIGAYNAFQNMKRCRVNFFSKFLYFLGKALKMTNYPLIFDVRVAKTIAQLTSTNLQLCSILNVQPEQDPNSFNIYVTEMHNISRRYNVEADKIEFFLFNGL